MGDKNKVEEKKEDVKNENSFEDESKDIDARAKSIAEKIISEMNKKEEESEEAKSKKEKLAKEGGLNVKTIDAEKKIYTSTDKFTGERKDFTIKQSQIDQVFEWFKCLIDNDKKGAAEVAYKLGPLVEGTNARGGFLVPTILASFLTEVMDDVAVIQPRSNVIDMSNMKTDQLDISGIATKPKVSWTDEATDKSTTSMTFGQISLTPYKLAALDSLSKELREDSPFNIVQIYSRKLAEAVVREKERTYINGNGTGQPTGIDSYTLRNINAGGALSFNHINSAYWLLPQAYRSKAYWIMNGRTIAAVANFQDSNNFPILNTSGLSTEPTVPSLLGRPVLEQNDATSDRIFFGDLSNYHIATKGPLEISVSEEASIGNVNLWERNLIGIRVEERVDAELEPTASFIEVQNTGVS